MAAITGVTGNSIFTPPAVIDNTVNSFQVAQSTGPITAPSNFAPSNSNQSVLSTYAQNVSSNFTQTNTAFQTGIFLLPSGVGLATAGTTAQSTGGITLLGTLPFWGTSQFGGALLFAGINTIINTAAVGGALQFGILAGSMINQIPINSSGGTVQSGISSLLFQHQ